MSLVKLVAAVLILGPFGYGMGWILGYLWFGTSSLFGVLGACLFTLCGAVSNATGDLPRKTEEELSGPEENFTLFGQRFNRYGDDD
jgi:hypothetical protein